MTKPFSSMQSPESIAKSYGGDKQKIAQAMQMGVVDPTAGVLAGMFIDRMRAPQAQEGASPSTVAQQVMGGAPPAPANPLPAGGLGGTSPAGAPPMAPPMGASPMPAPGAPPMGMAMGGLTSLPIPDAMFDEPDNGSYAGGGIVAFDEGGPVMADLYDDVEYVESRGNQNAVSPKGARGVMQLMPGTMRDPGFGVRPMKANTEAENRRVGQEYLEAMYRRYGDRDTALIAYNWGPGNADRWLKAGADRKKLPKETRDYVAKVTGMGGAPAAGAPAVAAAPERAAGNPVSILDSVGKFRDVLTQNTTPDTKRREAMAAELEGAIDPGARKADRESRRWEALAQFGFQLAQSPGSLLQAASAAASQVLPTLRKGDEEARKELRADQAALMSLEDKSNEEKQKIELLALELAKAEAGLLSDERKMDLQYSIAKMDDATRRAITAMSNTTQLTISREGNMVDMFGLMTRPKPEAAQSLIPGPPTQGGASSGNVVDFSQLK